MEISNKKINLAIKRKFIKPLNDGIKYNINQLKNVKEIKHKETISLLIQSYITLNNIEDLLKKQSLVDANALLRSSFEYILVGMMMQFEEEVFKEFINLSIDDENGRNYTKIQKLINRFKTHLNKISPNLFENINRDLKGLALTDLYDKLCKFTHSSLFVTTIVEMKNSDEEKILKMLNYQNLYFVKILLYCCLKYFTNDAKHYIYEENLGLSILFYYYQISIQLKNSKLIFDKYKDFLYISENEKYFIKAKKYNGKIQKNFTYLKENSNDKLFIEAVENFLE